MLELSQILSFYPEHMKPFKTNLLREYLQYKILEAIFDSPYGATLSFMGGTCIHIIHGNPRFSEDLDFDNLGLSKDAFEDLSKTIVAALEKEGYTVELKNTFRDAYRAYLRFSNILFESGLSGHKEEKLLVQVDTEPQHFDYTPDKFVLNKFDVFLRINAVPADVLLAQKFYCILHRKRAMGRDFLDASFLMGKTGANMNYLKCKLDIESKLDLKARLLSRCRQLNFGQLAKDVEPFILAAKDIKKVTGFPELVDATLWGRFTQGVNQRHQKQSLLQYPDTIRRRAAGSRLLCRRHKGDPRRSAEASTLTWLAILVDYIAMKLCKIRKVPIGLPLFAGLKIKVSTSTSDADRWLIGHAHSG